MTADELSHRLYADASPLKWERVRRGLSLRQAADALGLSTHTTLSEWEDGHMPRSVAVREQLVAFYGCAADELFSHVPSPDRACKVDDCNEPMRARGLCWKHYQREFRGKRERTVRPSPVASEPVFVVDRARPSRLREKLAELR